MNGGYLKRYGPSDPGSPELEALGLRWLGAVAGGVRAARVLRVGQRELELERLPNSGPADGAPEAFGRALARTHAAGAPWHGAPPAGWDQPAGSIGLAPMAFVPAGRAGLPWGEFYATYRVEPYVRLARDAHQFGSGEVAVFEVLCARLAAGEFDAPQPALVPGGAARLHGDLWAG
ncbi:MAG: hypothetical protein LBR19_02740, partial [Bifidobacteriaceae bacterium]|nr:hypothetical protein [Bifidobacteriaceae bacterium]